MDAAGRPISEEDLSEAGSLESPASLPQAVKQGLVDALVNGRSLRFDEATGAFLLTDSSPEDFTKGAI